ncbi:MAG: AraC family transcriptional regulator [Bacteroidetes bacterium]|nr:MAG: AraC family transcriptional regulator [Bacteroidota bacterium]
MKAIYLPEGRYCGNLDKSIGLDFAWLSFTRYHGEDSFHRHYHENSYLSVVGFGPYTETNKTGTVKLENGEIIFRPAGYNHANSFCGQPGLCFNIEFKKNWQEHTDFNWKLPRDWKIYPCGSFPAVYKSMLAFMEGDDPGHISEYLSGWFCEINETRIPETGLAWIKKVKDILENETGTHHSLQALAGRVHVHPVHLASAFRRKTGFTIGEYQLRARLKKSARLLLNSTKDITGIALECGFYDTAHFIHKFRAAYASSPARFRKKIKT